MRLKSFYAKTMTEAMQQIRETLGEDAIIVATREENGGKSVRVTAAVEERSPAFELGKAGEAAAKAEWLQYDEEEDAGAITEDLTDVMIRHGVPETVTDQILSYAMVMGFGDVHKALIAALENLFTFRPLTEATHKTRFLFVGPPGAGKTLTTAKFAARSLMNGENVAIITTDTERAGAVEQLQAFTDVMDIPMVLCKDGKELAAALDQFEDMDYVYIDSPGVNPFDPKSLKVLVKLIGAGSIEPVLVLPAALDAYESEDLARIYATLGVEILIPTRIDMARRYGGLLAAAHSGNLSFAETGIAQTVVDGLTDMTPKRFANILVPDGRATSIQKPD